MNARSAQPVTTEPGPTPPAGPPPALAATPAGTILVIDPDGVSRRFVELTLGQQGFVVESVADARGALDILGTTPVQLIISEIDFPDMNGLQLHRRLTRESRLRGIPFLFLSADTRVATKSVALAAGVDDYLCKPCEAAELLARVKSHIGRQRRAGELQRNRGYTLAGQLSTIPFPDLVSIIQLGRRSGRLSLVTPDRIGTTFFRDGQVVHALFGNLSGATAFHWMVAEEQGQFEFSPGECEIGDDRRTIFDSVTALLMESARVIDTERAGRSPAGTVAPEQGGHDEWKIPTVPDGKGLAPVAAVCPTPSVAVQLQLALADGYALGDLQLFTHEDLQKWTRAEVGRERFHVHLIADLAAGVSSLLSLAGAPTERCLLDSLTPAPKVAGLTFCLRHERIVDVLLIDIANPREALGSLERTPALTIFAPTNGDFLTIGPANRADLEALLARLPPPALLGLGGAGLEEGLRSFLTLKASDVRLRVRPSVLGQAECDLRGVLIEGLRLCASQESPGTERLGP